MLERTFEDKKSTKEIEYRGRSKREYYNCDGRDTMEIRKFRRGDFDTYSCSSKEGTVEESTDKGK